MKRARLLLLTTAALASLVGCGDKGPQTPASPTTAKTVVKSMGLPKPLKPRCGVGRFATQTIRPVNDGGKKSWQFSFILAPTAPKINGQTTTLTVLETAPHRIQKVVGARFVNVAGRRVSLRKKTPQIPNHIAEWKTPNAHYVALADGDTTEALVGLIRCLP